jgi:hypothetical protein
MTVQGQPAPWALQDAIAVIAGQKPKNVDKFNQNS